MFRLQVFDFLATDGIRSGYAHTSVYQSWELVRLSLCHCISVCASHVSDFEGLPLGGVLQTPRLDSVDDRSLEKLASMQCWSQRSSYEQVRGFDDPNPRSPRAGCAAKRVRHRKDSSACSSSSD